MILYKLSDIRFQTDLRISMLCEFLRGVLKNRDSLEDTRQLPCVQLLGRGVTVYTDCSLISLGPLPKLFTSWE